MIIKTKRLNIMYVYVTINIMKNKTDQPLVPLTTSYIIIYQSSPVLHLNKRTKEEWKLLKLFNELIRSPVLH
jgi:hypothetical protein